MNQTPESDQKNIPFRAKLEKQIKNWLKRTKALHGEPRYVAMGMAVGIFVSATPTIPFQTLIAVAICLVMRGSKAAAAVGVWLSNPLTFPIFYLASYKTGAILFGIPNGHTISSYNTADMLELGVDITVAAVAGGIVIGIILGVIAYFLTFRAVTKIRSREKRHMRLLGRRKRTKDREQPATSPSDESKAENRCQMAERTEQQTDDREQRAHTGSKIAPALVSDPSDPACEYSKTIFCQSVTKDQRPGT
jgi:uncharacterized protein (DUF2062 family)